MLNAVWVAPQTFSPPIVVVVLYIIDIHTRAHVLFVCGYAAAARCLFAVCARVCVVWVFLVCSRAIKIICIKYVHNGIMRLVGLGCLVLFEKCIHRQSCLHLFLYALKGTHTHTQRHANANMHIPNAKSMFMLAVWQRALQICVNVIIAYSISFHLVSRSAPSGW